jgi:hypothetical protein
MNRRLNSGVSLSAFRINDFELVTLTFASWNQIAAWLRQLDRMRATG